MVDGIDMPMTKVTLTLDQATVTRLEQAASCLALPKSQVVREAIAEFSERIGRLSERERLNLLRTFDEVVPRIPGRDVGQVDRELIPSLVLYEWLHGPRLPEEIAAQEALFPSDAAVPFGSQEAALSANLYRSLSRPRGREIDLAIAACAIIREAELWTLNNVDFKDIPNLHLSHIA
jgi:predicted nucleic acid-binding protein